MKKRENRKNIRKRKLDDDDDGDDTDGLEFTVLSCIVLSHLGSSWLVLSCLVWSRLALPCLVLSCLAVPCPFISSFPSVQCRFVYFSSAFLQHMRIVQLSLVVRSVLSLAFVPALPYLAMSRLCLVSGVVSVLSWSMVLVLVFVVRFCSLLTLLILLSVGKQNFSRKYVWNKGDGVKRWKFFMTVPQGNRFVRSHNNIQTRRDEMR